MSYLCQLWAICKDEFIDDSAQSFNCFRQIIGKYHNNLYTAAIGGWFMVVAMQLLNATLVSSWLWTKDLFRLLKTLSNSQRPQLKSPIKFVQKAFLFPIVIIGQIFQNVYSDGIFNNFVEPLGRVFNPAHSFQLGVEKWGRQSGMTSSAFLFSYKALPLSKKTHIHTHINKDFHLPYFQI